MDKRISFADQAEAVERVIGYLPPPDVAEMFPALAEAIATLRDLDEGKFVSDGHFRVPNPVWDDMTKPCPRCGVRFVITVGGGDGGKA